MLLRSLKGTDRVAGNEKNIYLVGGGIALKLLNVMNDFFKLQERGTTLRTELSAGVTTFLTMAYIIFVNPGILAAAGVPFAGAATATALGAAGMCLLMGLVTNRLWPSHREWD